MPGYLPHGKLPAEMLATLLESIATTSPDVTVGPCVGVDAAVVSLEDRCLVMAMDPVTLSAEPGRYVVQINANDVAVMGARPRWLLATVLAPSDTQLEDVSLLMGQMVEACEGLDIALVGGHTEITSAVNRIVVAGCLVGEAPHGGVVTAAGVRPGDAIILAGQFPLEGCAVLAREYRSQLSNAGVLDRVLDRASRWLDEPGISVLPAVAAVTGVCRPHGMHDPTEGGVSTGLYELAAASGVGIKVHETRLKPPSEAVSICAALGIDPLNTLASGSLLVAVAPQDAGSVLESLIVAGVPADIIGRAIPGRGVSMVGPGGERPLATVDRDELARLAEDMGRTT